MSSRRALGMWTVIAVGLVILVGAILYDQSNGERQSESGPQRLARGAQGYDEHCAACHGANLEGQRDWRKRGPDGLLPAPPHDATGHTWHHPDQQLFAITKYGTAAVVGPEYKTTMGGFGDVLDDHEIRDVLAFIKSRWPEEIRRRQAGITARAGKAD